ncbi:hypothetical protein CHO01_39190 [Cellulomonas hominis]|uniref:Lipoprotein n=1 Tax=Cellulomonas hominis TaxID=156981 RepID=A0A511FHW2_9CELL|nr:hypothetical protein [Cellulomonas hominis]MBB5474799.1 hypothetical protein [Cellulomonas hominis]NKY06615.1 hypothetical protein [Cellulomonas hominis]GEL48803.1 hypothetical protein CHO01_39190 [Cellulomonas hominis]
MTRTSLTAVALLAATALLAGCSSAPEPSDPPAGVGTVVVPTSPVGGQSPDPSSSPSPEPTPTYEPAAAPGDDYSLSHPGQTLPDAPYSAGGAGLYTGEQWPAAGVDAEAWRPVVESFVAAVSAPEPDAATWLQGVRPYVTDRLLDRLAQDGVRTEVSAWGSPELQAVSSMNEDHGVAIVETVSPNPSWSQAISLWFFADGTWRVDTFGLPWQ